MKYLAYPLEGGHVGNKKVFGGDWTIIVKIGFDCVDRGGYHGAGQWTEKCETGDGKSCLPLLVRRPVTWVLDVVRTIPSYLYIKLNFKMENLSMLPTRFVSTMAEVFSSMALVVLFTSPFSESMPGVMFAGL
jgi:hypothetical protein